MKELYEKVAADPALQKQLVEILSVAEEKGTEATEAALLAFAREQGFETTMKEIREFFEGMQAAGELSENELDQVAGGKVSDTIIAYSVLTVGLACAYLSACGAINSGKEGCEMMLEGLDQL